MESPELSAAQLAIVSAALSGDPGRLYHIVSGLLGDGVPFETVLFDLLIPAERSIGRRWQQGDYLVSEEHAATSAIETVISLLAGSFELPDDGPVVILGAAQGDDHSLPSRAIAAHLVFLGNRAVMLGANTFSGHLREYLESQEADALVLSCAMTTHLPGARAVIKASHEAGVPVLAGGKGFGADGEWADAMGADAWVDSLRDVASTLESWTPDIDASEIRAARLDDGLADLIDNRPGIISQAKALIPQGSIPPEKRARALSEMSLLLDSVIAAKLVDDERVVREMLHWQALTHAAHGLSFGNELAAALQDALEGADPEAARVLEGARQG